MLERLFGPLARRFRWVAIALSVQTRFGEVKGGFLASAVTLNMFVSLFPLLLVGIAVLGFFTTHNTQFVNDVIDAFGLNGQAADTVKSALDHAASTKKTASLIGLLGLVWSGLGVVGAIGHALDVTWQQTGRDIKDRLRGLVWLAGTSVILGSSIAVTALVNTVLEGPVLLVASTVVAIVLNFGFWLWTFLSLTYNRVTWRAYVPGSALAAIGLELIKQVTATVPQLFEGSSTLYGSIGAVFTLLAIIALFSRLSVYASILNVVLWEGEHGTVTVDVETPRIPGEVPLEGTRTGAVEPPVIGNDG